MLHVDAFHRTDALGEVEHLRLRERGRGRPAFAILPDHRRVEAFFDGGPDGEVGRELVATHLEVGAVTHADLLDFVKKVLLGVLGEHVGHTWLHAHADEGQQALLLPRIGPVELVVAQLHAASVVRVALVGGGQGHGHVHVVAARLVGRVEDGLVEDGVDGVVDEVHLVLARQGDHLCAVSGVDGFYPHLGRRAELAPHLGGPLDVVVRQYELLHPGLVFGEDSDSFAHSSDAYQQHFHLRTSLPGALMGVKERRR